MIDLLFSSQFINIATTATFIYLGVLWFTLVIWTITDIMKRSDSFLFQLFATFLVMIFNILGLIIYYVIRPKSTLQELYDEALEREYVLKQTKGDRCSKCKNIVREDYLVCPYCTNELKNKCKGCKSLIDPSFRVCPYCRKEQEDGEKSKKK